MPQSIWSISEQHRRALLARDAATLARIEALYGKAALQISGELHRLIAKMDAARSQGQTISASWLFQEQRLSALLTQANQQMLRFSASGAQLVKREQFAAAKLGQAHTLEQLGSQIEASFNRLPKGALEAFAGAAGDGSPLKSLFDQLGRDTSQQIQRELFNGLAQGKGPQAIARRIESSLDGNSVRARSLARTETLRAYRSASDATAEASGVIVAKQRLAAKSARTCAACLALDGRIYPLDAEPDNHVNCRCTWLYLTEDMYQKAVAQPRQTGAEWFADQPEKIQQGILGIQGAQAYRDGRLQLESFVGEANSPRWGVSRYQRSLKDALSRQPISLPSFTPAAGSLPPNNSPALPLSGPEPAGTPVSKAFSFPGGAMGKKLKEAARVIDSVHGDGPLPSLPVKQNASRRAHGSYQSLGPKAVRINISKYGDHPELTFAHEVGHFLDQQGIKQGSSQFASVLNHPAMERWRQAVENSPAIAKLREQLKTGWAEIVDIDGQAQKVRIKFDYVQYLLRTQEMWARSYAQYIATRSGDATMRRQLAGLLADLQPSARLSQWSEAEFAPIAEAMDDLFKDLGWRL